MSRHRSKAAGRVTLKNTRDGVVEHNSATGEDVRVGKREADLELRGNSQAQEPTSHTLKRTEMTIFSGGRITVFLARLLIANPSKSKTQAF